MAHMRSIRRSTAWLLFLFGVAPVLVLAGVVAVWFARDAVSNARIALQTTAIASDQALDAYLGAHRDALMLLARSPAVRASPDEATLRPRLDSLRERYPGFITAFYASEDGAVVAASPAVNAAGGVGYWHGIHVNDRAYFRETLARRTPYVSGIFKGRGYGQDQLIAIGVPVFDSQDRLRGVLAGGLDLGLLGDDIRQLTRRNGMGLVIVDGAGKVVYASPQFKLRQGQVAARWPLLAATLARPPGQILDVDPTLEGVRLAMQLPTHPEPGWRLVAIGQPDLVTEGLLASAGLLLLMVGLVLLALAVVVPFGAGRLSRPVRALAGELGRFDPDRDAGVPAAAVPELPLELRPILDGYLGMATRLRELYAQRGQLLAEREHEVERRTQELRRAVDALRDASLTDALTGLANYRAYRERLDALWATARAGEQPIGAVVIDIDHFKGYNDRYGHPAGDRCLRAVAGCLRATLGNAPQLLARNGGEEFIALFMPAERRCILDLAEQLRLAVCALAIEHANSPEGVVTLSVGVSVLVARGQLYADALVRAADLALYRAKREGRDRVMELSPVVLQCSAAAPAAQARRSARRQRAVTDVAPVETAVEMDRARDGIGALARLGEIGTQRAGGQHAAAGADHAAVGSETGAGVE